MVGLASGHTQEVYTVIYNENGAAPADIPNETIRKHDAVWFWMKDSTANASLIVTLTKGDLEYSSTNLTKECAVDEDGNKVDEKPRGAVLLCDFAETDYPFRSMRVKVCDDKVQDHI